MMLLQWPCFWAWTGVKFPHSQYACHSSKRMHQQHHVFKTLYILICGKIYRKHSLSQTWKVYLSTNLSIQNSIPSNASLCFPAALTSQAAAAIESRCCRTAATGASKLGFPPKWRERIEPWNDTVIDGTSVRYVFHGIYIHIYIYTHIYTYDIWYVLWDSWVLNGFCWVYLNGRILRAVFVLVSPYHGCFSLKTRISPTIHVTISMSWHCRMDIVGWDELL